MGHDTVDVVLEIVGQIQHGLTPLLDCALFMKLLRRLKRIRPDRVFLEDLDGPRHLADLIGGGQARHVHIAVAACQPGHRGRHILHGNHDAVGAISHASTTPEISASALSMPLALMATALPDSVSCLVVSSVSVQDRTVS